MQPPAKLVLEDGTVFSGFGFGAEGEAYGEVVFNTSMTGYQEVLTDPSYRGQIVTMTYPHIGNYGCNPEDVESSRPQVAGFVVRELAHRPSNFRATESLEAYLREHGIPAIEGVDTRRLVRHIRLEGAMKAVLSTADLDEASLIRKVRRSPGLVGRDLVREVVPPAVREWREGLSPWVEGSAVRGQGSGVGGTGESRDAETRIREGGDDGRLVAHAPTRPRAYAPKHVVALDFGMKHNIARHLHARGFRVTIVPGTATAQEVLAHKPDGVFLSNGPGDPRPVEYAVKTIRDLVSPARRTGTRGDIVPIFGICLGHQLLGLAFGGEIFKLKFGHRGANQPVLNHQTGRVEITTQNHGFALRLDNLPTELEATHVNLNDGTLEGMRHRELPIFSVQYHPEASAGPHDSAYLFDRFAEMVVGK